MESFAIRRRYDFGRHLAEATDPIGLEGGPDVTE
jgi:hypothetical protein